MRLQTLSSNWLIDPKSRIRISKMLKEKPQYQPNTIGNLLKSPIDSGLRKIYQKGELVRIV